MAERYLERTADQLSESLTGGLLVEDHNTDFKRELGRGASASKELAVDLASLSIDGGRLYIGVDEDGDPPALHPLPEMGRLAERIDQVARSRITPPLYVRCQQIPDPRAAGEGYLVVTVPPSPDAPHMVEGRYRGRGDITNLVLTDQEVRDALVRRAGLTRTAEQLLAAEIARDPTESPELRQHAHLFVVAQPVQGTAELLQQHIPDADWKTWLQERILAGPACRDLPSRWAPDLNQHASNISRRADGWAIHSWHLTQSRRVQPNGTLAAHEGDLLELEVREDGGLRLFCGRGSAQARPDDPRVLFLQLVAGLAWRVVRTALTIAEVAGYYGSWDLGLALTNLRDVEGLAGPGYYTMAARPVYSEEQYTRTVRVTYEQLMGDLNHVVHQLYDPLGRALSASAELPPP